MIPWPGLRPSVKWHPSLSVSAISRTPKYRPHYASRLSEGPGVPGSGIGISGDGRSGLPKTNQYTTKVKLVNSQPPVSNSVFTCFPMPFIKSQPGRDLTSQVPSPWG